LAHCGFPEKAYSKFADILVTKGYKVARVEQTETPNMMKERLEQRIHSLCIRYPLLSHLFFLEPGRKNKFDKTVRREICQITTPGTKTFNTLDNDNVFRESLYLLSIVEIVCLFKISILLFFSYFSQLMIIKSHHVNSVYVLLIQLLHNFTYV
jgi:DNA mismatch repair protein MSH6